MNQDSSDFLPRIVQLFDELKHPWALVGAVAINQYTDTPRFTADFDFAVAVPGDEAAKLVISAFQNLNFRPMEERFHPNTSVKTMVGLLGIWPGVGRILIDVLFGATTIEAEITASATRTEIQKNLVVPIATQSHLLATKVLAISSEDRAPEKRMTDKADIIRLLKDMSKSDLENALDMTKLIQKRYPAPLPNLNDALTKIVEEYAPNLLQ